MREGRPPHGERPSSVLGSVEYPSRISASGKVPHARPSVKLAGAFPPFLCAGYGAEYTIGLSCGLARWWRPPITYVLWRPVARPNGPQIAAKLPIFRKCGEKLAMPEHNSIFVNKTAGRVSVKPGSARQITVFSPHFRNRKTKACGKFPNPRAHRPFQAKKPRVEALPI